MGPYEGDLDDSTDRSSCETPRPAIYKQQSLDPSRLAPYDALYTRSPSRRLRMGDGPGDDGSGGGVTSNGAARGAEGARRRKREKDRARSGSRRRKGPWKKLLWVKQSCMCSELHVHG
jgi:phosphatidylinositol N-acetylglucosaminyltransferase subunit C